MPKSIFLKYIIPFLLWFGFMIFFAFVIDYLLHFGNVYWVGKYLGIPGTLMIIFSFIYSARKRNIIRSGSPRSLLTFHEYMAWGGSVLILVHAGIHYNAHLAWLATYMMIINVMSGLVGKFIVKSARESMNDRKQALIADGISAEAIEKELFYDSITFGLITQWRVIHLPIAMMFFILAILHIITIIIFS
ncbi:MAG: hypothetical protein IPO37_22525 [Saprospiraceae bacterium]|nr:hypothetical protein [Saprospiraceae bacterium]